jgi:transcription elongation GreA/GreB family factor
VAEFTALSRTLRVKFKASNPRRTVPRKPAAPLPDKAAVRARLVAALERALASMVRAAESARQGAVHEESRAEGDKDMRATEQSYLARGQAMRVEDLAEQLQRLVATPLVAFGPDDPIAPGALVRVRVDGAPRVVLVAVQGGGETLDVDGTTITVVTPASPVGRALLGLRVGDVVELPGRDGTREWEVDTIS